ncbi:hypothetical protein HLI_06365 [Halobacillus litoralis]|uniref:Uncharacterized protein n=1 Tax=Halobacillus litoralis TaxID=45668 RepID=A0A410MAW3_9BACI|nr:hypothetical protein HLI_06365 [Halobacillus litoralis]
MDLRLVLFPQASPPNAHRGINEAYLKKVIFFDLYMFHRSKEAELNDKIVLPGLSLMHNSESCSSSVASTYFTFSGDGHLPGASARVVPAGGSLRMLPTLHLFHSTHLLGLFRWQLSFCPRLF